MRSFIALSLIGVATVYAHNEAARVPIAYRHQRRMEILVKRQNVTGPTEQETTPPGIVVPTTTPPADNAPEETQTQTVAETTTRGILESIINPGASSSTTVPVVVGQTTTTLPAAVQTTPVSETTSLPVSSATTRPPRNAATTPAAGTTIVTSVTTSSPSGTATAAPAETENKSSGLPKTTLIIIIVVASVVAGIAAIWTIIRKVKFSPSKRFEAKLEPIDFSNGAGGAAPGGVKRDSYVFPEHHGRSPSQMSSRSDLGKPMYPASLSRSDSGRSYGAPVMAEMSSIPGSIPYNAPHAGYGQQAYYASTPAPGYQQDQDYGYTNLQRGGSSRYPTAAAPTPAPYHYGQQQQHGATGRPW